MLALGKYFRRPLRDAGGDIGEDGGIAHRLFVEYQESGFGGVGAAARRLQKMRRQHRIVGKRRDDEPVGIERAQQTFRIVAHDRTRAGECALQRRTQRFSA